MGIRDIIREIARGGQTLGCMACKVTAVDKTARTVDVEPLNEDAPVLACNLQANQGSAFGVVQFPRVDSYVVVGFLSGIDAGVVLMCDDVEGVEIVVKDKDTASVVVSEDGIVMNNGTLDGLVKINELTDKLNNLVKEVNAFIKTYNTHTHIGAHGTTSTPSATGTDVSDFKKSDYENEKVKQ